MEPDSGQLMEEKAALLVDALIQGHSIRFKSLGGSMSPLIPHESLVTIHPCQPFELRRGDVALCVVSPTDDKNQAWILHRVISHNRRTQTLSMAGDRLPMIDEPRLYSQVVGVLSEVSVLSEGSVLAEGSVLSEGSLVTPRSERKVIMIIWGLISPLRRFYASHPRSLLGRSIGLASFYLQRLRGP